MKKKSRLRSDEFFRNHPHCCYCGGNRRATTRDHAPPIAFFENRQRPKGLEVPACKQCHDRFSAFDDIFSVFSFIQKEGMRHDGAVVPLARLRANQRRFPKVFEKFASNPENVLLSNDGLLLPAVKVPIHDELAFVVHLETARLACAIFYSDVGEALDEGCHIATMWQSNTQQFKKGLPEPILELVEFYGTLSQGRFEVSEQFEYAHKFDRDTDLGVILFHYHQTYSSIGFLYGKECPQIDMNKGGLFKVTAEGIAPVNLKWPSHVRKPRKESPR